MLRKRKVREEQAIRIKEAMLKKREMKKQQQREDLQRYNQIMGIENESERLEEIRRLEFENEDELLVEIKNLKIKLGLIEKNELVSLQTLT